MITDFKDKMKTIETIIQGILTSLSSCANETLIFDFSNMHQTTNGMFVKQTTSDISKRKTSKTFFLYLLFALRLKTISENWVIFSSEIENSLLINILITFVLKYGPDHVPFVDHLIVIIEYVVMGTCNKYFGL